MRIIFADGHDNFRSVIVDLLRDDGHEVHAAAQGGELVTMARRLAPHVIVSHARFDDISAFDALEYLAQANVRVPTILMSGDIRTVPHEQAERLGVVACIEKPFSMNALRSMLEVAARASSVELRRRELIDEETV